MPPKKKQEEAPSTTEAININSIHGWGQAAVNHEQEAGNGGC